MSSSMAICSCKDNSTTNLVVAVKVGFFEMGWFSWLIHIVLSIVTLGSWLGILFVWEIFCYFFTPTYKCQFCNKAIEKSQFRDATQMIMAINQKMIRDNKQAQELKDQEELKKKDEVKNYRTLLFKKSEAIDILEKISDSQLQKYFVDTYLDKIKSDITTYRDTLEDINDKVFAKTSLERLSTIKAKTDLLGTDYKNQSISKLNTLMSDLNKIESDISSFGNPNIDANQIKIKKKVKPFMTSLNIFLAITSVLYLLQVLLGMSKYNNTSMIVVMSLVLFVASWNIRYDIKFFKNYDTYKSEQEIKIQEQSNKNRLIEQKHQDDINQLKRLVDAHESIKVLEEVNIKYPQFHRLKEELSSY
jgi:hypothetical protein